MSAANGTRTVGLHTLKSQRRNANKGTARGQELIAGSLKEFGAGRSILLDKHGEIIAGSKTFQNAAAAGITEAIVVPSDGSQLIAVQRMDLDLSEKKAKRLAIADNRTTELDLDWDPDVLATEFELGDLTPFFADDELRALGVPGIGEIQEDDPSDLIDHAAELQAKWGTERGQLWEIPSKTVTGKAHRLMCGDVTLAENIQALLDKESIRTLVTSPPYWTGQSYDNKPGTVGAQAFISDFARCWAPLVSRRIQIQTGHTNSTLIGDSGPMRKVLLDAMWAAAFESNGWLLRHRRIWAKGGGSLHVSPVGDLIDESWEVILTFYRAGANEGGQERVSEDWVQKGFWTDIAGIAGDGSHPCPFPVELPSRMIRLYSRTGDIIADPFLGSGTTMIAAEQLSRLCYGMEIEPKYIAVTLERCANLGLTPKLCA